MRNDDLFIEDMLQSVALVERYFSEMNEATFIEGDATDDLQVHRDAIVRRLEIIGEAARHLTEEYTQARSAIPWQKIRDMRNLLIHEYFGIDYETVVQVIKRNLPPLKQALLA